MLLNFICVAIGGALGAALRFGIFLVSTHWLGNAAPWGTLFANLFGCFVIGVLVGYGMHKQVDAAYLLCAVGLLGALTTFSTFSVETLMLALDDRLGWSILNVLGNVLGSLFSCYLGLQLAAFWSGSNSLVG
jgi:CrcB protein